MPLSLNHLEKDKIVCIKTSIFLVNGYVFRYKKENSLDCQIHKDLSSLRSDGTPNHDNCKAWCNSRYGCGAFAVYRGTCYFKTNSCYKTYTSSTAVLYLKFGNYLSHLKNMLFCSLWLNILPSDMWSAQSFLKFIITSHMLKLIFNLQHNTDMWSMRTLTVMALVTFVVLLHMEMLTTAWRSVIKLQTVNILPIGVMYASLRIQIALRGEGSLADQIFTQDLVPWIKIYWWIFYIACKVNPEHSFEINIKEQYVFMAPL